MPFVVQRVIVAEVFCEAPAGCNEQATHQVEHTVSKNLKFGRLKAARHFKNLGWQLEPVVLCPQCLRLKNQLEAQKTRSFVETLTAADIEKRVDHFMRIKATAANLRDFLSHYVTGVDLRGAPKHRLASIYATCETFNRAGGVPVITEEMVTKLIATYGQRSA